MDDEFIWVNGWDEYQSFQKKRGRAWAPPWIKLYPRLLSNHDFLNMSEREQLLLLKLFMLFASAHQVVANSPRSLSNLTGQRVMKSNLVSLNHAGFIGFCSRTVLEQRRSMFQNGSILEVEEEKEVLRALRLLEAPPSPNGKALGSHQHQIDQSLAEADG